MEQKQIKDKEKDTIARSCRAKGECGARALKRLSERSKEINIKLIKQKIDSNQETKKQKQKKRHYYFNRFHFSFSLFVPPPA